MIIGKETDAIDLPGAEAQPKKSVPKNQEFPYLNFDNLTEKDREDLVTKLVNEYTTINMKFAVLVGDTLKSLEAQSVTLEKLKVVITAYLSGNKNLMLKLFEDVKSLDQLFMQGYWSFFDYELIAVIIESLCKELKPNLAEYVAIFNEYCKRRCSEVPTCFNSKIAGKKYYTLTVKLSKELDQMRMDDVKELERQLKGITEQDFVLSHFKDGCIELIFISLSEEGDIPAISAEHKDKLFQMSVLKIYSANCVYYDRGESSPSDAQSSYPGKLFPNPNISQQEIELIAAAVKQSNKVEDLAAALGMSDCLEDVNGDVKVLLQQWQERADLANIPKRSHILYYIARIGMQDIHENLELQMQMEMQSELESLRLEKDQSKDELQKEKSSYHQSLEEKSKEIAHLKMKSEQEKSVYQQTVEENDQLKDKLQQEGDESQYQPSKQDMEEKKIHHAHAERATHLAMKRRTTLLAMMHALMERMAKRRLHHNWEEDIDAGLLQGSEDLRSSRSTGEEKQKMQGHEDSKVQESQVASVVQGDKVSQGFSRPRTRSAGDIKQLMESHKAPLSLKQQKIQDIVRGDKDFKRSRSRSI